MNDKKTNSEKNRNLNDLNGKEWIKHTISWFTLKVRSRTKQEIKHPGKFPEELAERFIEYFTRKDQWVIDPFLGVGSTLVACRKLDRNGVGIEINPLFVDTANRMFEQQTLVPTSKQRVVCGDSLDLDKVLKSEFDDVPMFDLCVTSPPYWNMLKKHRGGSDSQHRTRKDKGLPLIYSEDIEGDISNIVEYDEYLDLMVKVFENLKKYMKDKSHLVIVLQNIRDENSNFVPIAWDLHHRLKGLYKPMQEQIWCQTDKKAGIWGFPKVYVSNVHHHYCLIFQNQ